MLFLLEGGKVSAFVYRHWVKMLGNLSLKKMLGLLPGVHQHFDGSQSLSPLSDFRDGVYVRPE